VIVTDEAVLRLPCEPVRDIREGGEIARKLSRVLEAHNKKAVKGYRKAYRRNVGVPSLQQGIGLSAPQIGIRKKVCVIRPEGSLPWVLMNPTIVDASPERISFTEGCLSFPGVAVETFRHTWVEVDTLNHGRLTFGPKTPEEFDGNSLLLAIAVQHEVSHLFGLLFFDFASKDSPSPWKESVKVDSDPHAVAV
jgi:peptide deformylase